MTWSATGLLVAIAVFGCSSMPVEDAPVEFRSADATYCVVLEGRGLSVISTSRDDGCNPPWSDQSRAAATYYDGPGFGIPDIADAVEAKPVWLEFLVAEEGLVIVDEEATLNANSEFTVLARKPLAPGMSVIHVDFSGCVDDCGAEVTLGDTNSAITHRADRPDRRFESDFYASAAS